MKKIWLIFPILCFTFLLSGCARAIPEKEAAALLVDHLVYQKSEKKFTENFQDGEDLSNAFQTNEQAFQKVLRKGCWLTARSLKPRQKKSQNYC